MPVQTPDLRKLDRALSDIGNKIDGLFSKGGPKWLDDFIEAGDRTRNLAHEIGNLQDELEALDPHTDDWRKHNEIIKIFQIELKKAEKEASGLNAALKGGVAVFDKLGRGIISLGLGAFTTGMQQLSKAVYKVWDVLERATKVAGEFALQIGSASGNFKNAQKFGSAWEGTIRGMTDAQGMGMKMAADFIETIDRMPLDAKTKEGNRYAKMQMGLARGFNLGGEGAGEFADTMRRLTGVLGESEEELKKVSDKQAEQVKDQVAAAKAAGVPVNKFFKDIAKAGDFFLSVGESGRKGLTTAIGFVKKLGVSVKDLEKMTDKFDTFDDTAKSVAKLNTVFGTTINAMDVMLEQDPGKRFEIIRQQLKGQGKAFTDLSRVEKKVIEETTGLSMKSIQGMLDSGLSLEEFEKKQAVAQEKKLKAEDMIRSAMQKTATTMFAFKAAWDNVFMAVSRLIKPFTDVLGLTRSGEKGAKSFSQVMDGLFKRLIKFIDEVAANKDWQSFMKKLAKDATDLAGKISAIATGPGLGEWIKTIVKAGTDFYDIMKSAFTMMVTLGKPVMKVVQFIGENLTTILAAWGAMKIASMGMGAASMLGGAGMAGAGALAGSAGMGAAGGVGGYMLGGYASRKAGNKNTDTGSTGGIVGGIAGAIAGAFLGPGGALIGGAMGAAAGRFIGDAISQEYKSPEMKLAQDRRIESEKTLTLALAERNAAEKMSSDQLRKMQLAREIDAQKQNEVNGVISDITKKMVKSKGSEVDITEEERKQMLGRLKDLKSWGNKSEQLQTMMSILSEPSNGAISVTRKELNELASESAKYLKALEKLRDATDKQAAAEEKAIEFETRKKKLVNERDVLTTQQEISSREELLKNLDKMSAKDMRSALFSGQGSADASVTEARLKKMTSSGFMGIGAKSEKEAVKELLKDRYNRELEEQKTVLNDRKKEMLKIEKDNAEKILAVRIKQEITSSKEFLEFAKKRPYITDPKEMLDLFLGSEEGKGVGGMERKALQAGNVKEGGARAAGGIVTSPTRALVGEAGPEAIVPLKALVSGGDSLSSNSIGASVASDIVNYAQGRAGTTGTGGGREVSIEVPIYLDSSVIGRAVSRSMLSDYEV